MICKIFAWLVHLIEKKFKKYVFKDLISMSEKNIINGIIYGIWLVYGINLMINLREQKKYIFENMSKKMIHWFPIEK